MPTWRMAGEPSLDELLGDEIVHRMMRRDGIDASELRLALAEMARRIAARRRENCGSGCGSGVR